MQINFTKDFKRDLAKHLEVTVSPAFVEIMYLLQHNEPLPAQYKDHQLTGKMRDFRDCHVKNDLVLIYQITENSLNLVRLNTHSEVFK